MSTLVGTISSPLATRSGGIDVSRLLRSALSALLAVAILAVALPVAFGSSAGASGGASPVQVFSSGSLVAPEAGGSAHLSVAGLVPGAARTATVRVTNPGSAAALALAARVSDQPGAGGETLSSALRLKVEVAGSGKVLFNGTLAGLHRLGLGDFAAGAQRAYRFTVVLPADTGNAVAGAATSASFSWSAS
ncbi:MAG TPA: hypothetical protein VG816_05940 [Solirubrobacterales bacterium]|nr:hypothetical protein [Solirubrobacterales bacterium]